MWPQPAVREVRLARAWRVAALAFLLLVGPSAVWLGPPSSAAQSPYGIVPLGTTNEGLHEGGAATGIVDITGGPCIGPVITRNRAERLATRITLYQGAHVVAQWEIYGAQRIAWVEPVGHYSVSASDYRNGDKVHIVVNATTIAAVNLNPGCL